MMKKFATFVLAQILAVSLVACGNVESSTTEIIPTQEATKSTETPAPTSESYTEEPTAKPQSTSPSYSTPKPTERVVRYCDASGCSREGTKKYESFTGRTEYYCYTHYNEIIDMMSDMEESVGKGSYSKHTCEQCSREGTHSIIGFSGSTEYYCSTHYEELKELLEMFG